MKRVALKYCGGCNPVYDRERYVAAIRRAAGARIDWVSSGGEGAGTFLVVNGCRRACMLEEFGRSAAGRRLVSVQTGDEPPGEVVRLLLMGTGRPRDPEEPP